jgi:hypothetical protein
MKIEDLTARLNVLSPKEEVFEQLVNDSIYEYIVKETVKYMVNVKNEQDCMLTADKVRVFVGFLSGQVIISCHENEYIGLMLRMSVWK